MILLRLGLALVAMLLPLSLLSGFRTSLPPRDGVEPTIHLGGHLGDWQIAGDERLDPETLALIQPDAHLLRRYELPAQASADLYLGLYLGRAGYGAGAHDPQVCYPAQGWEIVDSDSVALPMPDGRLHARLLEVHNGGLVQTVLYWFQPAQRWPARAGAEELLRMVDALRGRPQYAFVRLSTDSTRRDPVARARLEGLARELAPAVLRLVDEQSEEL